MQWYYNETTGDGTRVEEYQKLAKSTAENYMNRLAKRRGVVVTEYRHRYVVIDNEGGDRQC